MKWHTIKADDDTRKILREACEEEPELRFSDDGYFELMECVIPGCELVPAPGLTGALAILDHEGTGRAFWDEQYAVRSIIDSLIETGRAMVVDFGKASDYSDYHDIYSTGNPS